MSLVFHYAPQSSATRVFWALEELGLPYEKVKRTLRSDDMRDPEFLKVNPNGRIPALVVDGVPMFESLAIVLHLGERYGTAKGLWPVEQGARATALTWAVWSSVTLAANGYRYLLNTSDRLPPEARSPAQAQLARQDVEDNLRVLEERLAGRAYLLGDAFTFVDVLGASALALLQRLNFPLEAYPKVKEWLGRCLSRPAFRTAVAG